MKRSYSLGLLVLSFILLGSQVIAQTPLKLEGAMFFDGYDTFGDTLGVSDVWGWEDDMGNEYAIMGYLEGVAIVKVPEMILVDTVIGPKGGGDPYIHRDIKTYRNYAYVVSEMTGTTAGIQIIDMSYLPDSVHYVKSHVYDFNFTSHNLSIDTAMAYAYVLNRSGNAIHFFDISDPENPVYDGELPGEVHDVYARNDTLWVAQGYSKKFSVWNVSDKSSPYLIAEVTDTDFGYCHNIWPTDDGKYFVTTEETDFKTIKVFDMSDTNSVVMTGEYLADCDLAHNVHVMGDSVYVSHYESGVTVVDISDKNNPTEVRYYDTYPLGDSPQFRGCWGVYPFTSSGLMYASSFEGWLHVLSFDTVDVSVRENPFEGGGLVQVFPNPSSGVFTFDLDLKNNENLNLEILDLTGREVAQVFEGQLSVGGHRLNWDGSGFSNGFYFAKLSNEKGHQITKLILAH